MPEIIFAFRVIKVKRTPKIREKINTWIVKFSFKNMSQLKSAAFWVYLEISPPATSSRITPIPGWRNLETAKPITKAKVVITSKYNKAFPPTRPTFFKFPILTIPKLMVKKMMGWINSLTKLINIPLNISLKEGPKLISVPSRE